MKASPDSSLSNSLLSLLYNALFPGGHPLLSHSVRCAHAEAVWAIASLRSHWQRIEKGAHEHRRLWELRPASEQARQVIGAWAAEQGFPAEVPLHEFLEQHPPDSPAEEAFVRDVFFPQFGEAGLVCLHPQVSFARMDGRQGRLDYVIASEDGQRKLAVEIDGKQYHGLGQIATEQFEDDRIRENELKIKGWNILRFAASTIFQRPELCAAQVSEMMSSLGLELPVTAEAVEVASLENEAVEAWILQRWKAHIAPAQQLFTRWAAETELPTQLRVCFPSAQLGVLPLALFDFFEVLERCCTMLRVEMPVEEVDLVLYEGSEEHRAWTQRLIQSYWHNREAELWRGWRSFRGAKLRWRIRLEVSEEPLVSSRDVDWMLFPHTGEKQLPLFARRLQKNTKQKTQIEQVDAHFERLASPPSKSVELPKASPQAARWLVERWFRFDRFRSGQWLLLKQILRGRSILGVLPSGLGKSLCYQWPALWMNGVSLVISPLTSLIREQVENLLKMGFTGIESITGDVMPDAQERALQRLERGECKLLFVAPERLQEGSFVRELQRITNDGKLNWRSFVVDEAHCASQWSTEFRPSYLRLPAVLKSLSPNAALLLLTSSNARNIQRDLLRLFELEDEALVQLPESERLEASLGIYKVRNENARWRELKGLLDKGLPSLLGAETLQEMHEGDEAQAGLVLVPYRGKADGSLSGRSEVSLRARPLAAALEKETGLECAAFVGTRDPEQPLSSFLARKHEIQNRFQEHSLPMVVSTRGVGAGLAPPNLRYVVETTTPASIEQYAQDSRRAGRDGEDAHYGVFWVPRARECGGIRPPCVERWECPYLDNLCSFGVQATLLWRDSAPALVEQRDMEVLVRRYYLPFLKKGGEFTLPLRLSFQTMEAWWPEQEPLSKEETQEFLTALKSWRWIRNYHWTGEEGGYQFTTSSHRLLTDDILRQRGLEEAGKGVTDLSSLAAFLAQQELEWEEEKAQRLAFFVYDLLRGRDGRSQSLRLRGTKETERVVDTERLLIRMQALGLVRWYEMEQRQWRVEVSSYQRRRTFEYLEESLHFLEEEEREALLELCREHTRGKPRVQQVLWLLERWTEAVQDTYEKQHWQALDTMEEFCENREQECRTQRLRRLLDPSYLPPMKSEPCGRCDICGIQPLDELKPHVEPAVEERLKTGLQWVADSFEQFNFARLQQIVELFEQLGLLSILRDRCLQGLQERPDSIFGLLGVTYAYHRLGDGHRASRASRALVRACLRQERPHQLDAVLRWLPPRLLAPLLKQMEAPLTQVLGRGKFHSIVCDLYLEEGQEQEALTLWLETLRSQTEEWQELPPLSELRQSLNDE